MADISQDSIAITREVITENWLYNEPKAWHRDDYHLFLIQEAGTSEVRIDFQEYQLVPKTIMCLHPNQVHQLGPFAPGTVSFMIMNHAGLLREHLQALEELTPLKPLLVGDPAFQLLSATITLCIQLYEAADMKMHRELVKQSCNLLVGQLLSAYLTHLTPYDKLSRFDMISRSFKSLLEQHFITMKRPGDYARQLNISTTYLYECVKQATGFSVTYHIEQRVILEAKRLLYYADRSVKEIAADLGYSDYPYFTRLFAKVTGMTAGKFRKQQRG